MRKFENLAVTSGAAPESLKPREGDLAAGSLGAGLSDGAPPLPRPRSSLRVGTPLGSLGPRAKGIIEAFSFLGLLVYAFLFWRSVDEWWFNPEWTTDDALQQVYPFYKALDPALFKSDLITFMMEQYLTPLHYGLNWLLTLATKDPIMSGHWGMLIQLGLTVGFVFAAVRAAAGFIPACFAAVWMLHTRHVVQRLTSGLPRGWAAPLFAAFFYFVLKGNHRGVLVTILIGCFLHPPATFVIAVAYGLHLLYHFARRESREAFRRPLFTFIGLSPLFALVAWLVVRMPPEIGTMASYEVAAQMPEFSTPDGRFPFYPLQSVSWEMNIFAFQAFIARFYNPGPFVRAWMPEVVVTLCLALAILGWRKKSAVFPSAMVCFLISAAGVYFLSRELAFKLYVPNRHLQFPFAMFFVVGLTIAVWRAGELLAGMRQSFAGGDLVRNNRALPWQSLALLVLLGALIGIGSGSGLQGSANFNYAVHKKGGVFEWVAEHTPVDALLAGEPTLIDGMMLFGKRSAYITTETAHPFYDKYYAAVKPRIEVTLRAHYARTLEELVQLLEPAGVDYFVFDRRKFYPEALKSAKYFKPFDSLVTELTSRPVDEFAFRKLPRTVDLERFPAMPFRDDFAALVDVKKLKAWLLTQNQLQPQELGTPRLENQVAKNHVTVEGMGTYDVLYY